MSGGNRAVELVTGKDEPPERQVSRSLQRALKYGFDRLNGYKRTLLSGHVVDDRDGYWRICSEVNATFRFDLDRDELETPSATISDVC